VIRLASEGDERMTIAAPQPTSAAILDGERVHLEVEGQSVEFRMAEPPTVEEAMRHASAGGEGAAVLAAPMPGRVIAVRAAAGDAVVAHQPIVVIEAMKMEHAVTTPNDGILERLSVTVGQQVQRGDILAEVVPRR
jgi:biotin carboxyl carrier protein